MSATHSDCIQIGPFAVYSKFCRQCVTCGFYKPEAERRKSLPLVYCEDGLYRKIIKRMEDEDGREE